MVTKALVTVFYKVFLMLLPHLLLCSKQGILIIRPILEMKELRSGVPGPRHRASKQGRTPDPQPGFICVLGSYQGGLWPWRTPVAGPTPGWAGTGERGSPGV